MLKKNLKQPIQLVDNDRRQTVVTSLITDVNFDSKNEILLGTHENVRSIMYS